MNEIFINGCEDCWVCWLTLWGGVFSVVSTIVLSAAYLWLRRKAKS